MKFLKVRELIPLKLLLFSVVIELLNCLTDKQINNINNGLNRGPNMGLNVVNSKNSPTDLNLNSKLNRLNLNSTISNNKKSKLGEKKKLANLFLTKLEKEIPFFGEWVQIRNFNNDFCLKFEGEDKKIIQSLCGNNDTFLWKIQKLPNKEGIYKIVSKKNSNYVLDIQETSLNKTLKAIMKQNKKTNNNKPLSPPNPNPNPGPSPNPTPNSIPNPNPNNLNVNIPDRLFRLHNENTEEMLGTNNQNTDMKKGNPNLKKLNSKEQKKVNSVRHDLNFGVKDPISTKKSSNATTQIWHIKKFIKKNFFVLKNAKTGKCLDNTGLPLAGREYQVFFCNKRNHNQAFYFRKPIENPFKNKTINLVNYNSKKCMKGVLNNGKIVQSKCDYAKHFEWKILKNFVDDGFFFLESKLGEYVLENFNWSKKLGNSVILSKPKGSPNQLWEFLYHKDKKGYMLKNLYSKKCLGNSGNFNEKAVFSLWECDENNPNLAFMFVRPRDNKFIKIVLPGLNDINAKKNNINMNMPMKKSNSKRNVLNPNANKSNKINNLNVKKTNINKKNKKNKRKALNKNAIKGNKRRNRNLRRMNGKKIQR